MARGGHGARSEEGVGNNRRQAKGRGPEVGAGAQPRVDAERGRGKRKAQPGVAEAGARGVAGGGKGARSEAGTWAVHVGSGDTRYERYH